MMNKTSAKQAHQQVDRQVFQATTKTMPTNFAQTISRSNNLHQQIFGHHQQAHLGHPHHQQTSKSRKNSIIMNSNNNNYDQPIIDPHLQHQLAYHHHHHHPLTASMTLASRPTKERQPLPLHMMANHHHLHHQWAYPQLNNTNHQTLPSNRFQPAMHQIYQEPHHQQAQMMMHQNQNQQQHQQANFMSLLDQQARLSNKPLCRCRVMYLGSSVPHITKNGLHGIQEPLRHLYPEEQFTPIKLKVKQMPSKQQQPQIIENTIDISHLSSSLGIDSWLSVWSNGLLLENVDEFGREIKRFFSIESLHYCAAVRYFDTTTLSTKPVTSTQTPTTNGHSGDQNNNAPDSESQQRDPNNNNNNNQQTMASEQSTKPQQVATKKGPIRFLPLDAPIFQCPGMLDANHPPVFGAIMRRTTGIKVLECHAFICRRDAAANALVRCCTHAYADFLSAKRLSVELGCPNMPQTGAYAYAYPFAGQGGQEEDEEAAAAASSSRSQRSLSVGGRRRHHHHHQNQVLVEAIINNNNPAGAMTGKQTKGSSHSSGGPASNETDDNSIGDDNSSCQAADDNYAIIPKQQQHQQTRTATLSNRRDRPSRHAQRKAKGSSKSLFNDFQPVIRDKNLDMTNSTNYNQQQSAIDRLSHSLDYLQCCQLQQQQQQQLQQAARNSRQDYEADPNVSYSIVKNKRHSRSMQNLDGPFEFSAAKATRSSRQSRGRTSSTRKTGNRYQRGSSVSSARTDELAAAGKKAASFQDMSALIRRGSITSQATNHSFGSQHKRRTTDRAPTDDSPNGLSTSIYDTCVDNYNEPEHNNNNNKTEPSQEYQRILKAEAYIAPPPPPPPLSMQARSAKMGAPINYNNSKSSSSQHNNHRRTSHNKSMGYLNDDEQTLIHAQHNTIGRQSRLTSAPSNYYAPYNAAHYGPPASGIYQHGHHHPIYMAQPVVGPPPPPPPPPHPHPYYMGQPMYAPAATAAMYDSSQPTYLAPGSLNPHQYNPYPAQCHALNQIAAGRTIYDNGMATIATSGRSSNSKKHISLKSASASLATRFRCLSPPVNFLTNNNDTKDKKNNKNRDSHVDEGSRTSEIYVTDRASLQQQQQQQLPPASQQLIDNQQTINDAPSPTTTSEKHIHASNGKRESLDSSPNGEPIIITDVVSGQPGFIQQQQQQQTSHSGYNQGKTLGKKLSWMKRLSLTMSSSGHHSGDDVSNTGTISSCSSSNNKAPSLSVDPCGPDTGTDQQQQQQQQIQTPNGNQQPTGDTKESIKQKRKKTGFFGGSLTLGRSSHKSSNSSKPSLVPHPT